jgi:hypothetical protein
MCPFFFYVTSEMPSEIAVAEARNLVHVHWFGIVTAGQCRQDLTKILALCEDHSLSKVLVDATDVSSWLSTIETFDFFSNYPTRLKSALVINQSEPFAKEFGFVEDVSRNRGRMIKVFDTEQQAYAWLYE